MNHILFSIENLIISVENKEVVSGVSFVCTQGSVHVLMGPNGSGKSSLAAAIMGHPRYKIDSGAIFWNGDDIACLSVEERARRGIFLAVQYPYAIPGLSVFSFLKEAYTAIVGQSLSVEEFEKLLSSTLAKVGLSADFMHRSLNDGFSGGERKRLECAQVLLLRPRLIILDEIDSGLDADGVRLVAQALQEIKRELPDSVWILITHYTRLFDFIKPDQVHVLQEGSIAVSGDNVLIAQIDTEGYRGICNL